MKGNLNSLKLHYQAIRNTTVKDFRTAANRKITFDACVDQLKVDQSTICAVAETIDSFRPVYILWKDTAVVILWNGDVQSTLTIENGRFVVN